MPLNAQDLWVVLKAQDMATRALNAYSRSVRKAGTDTRLAQLEAAQGNLRYKDSQLALARSVEANTIAQRNNEKQILRQQLAAAKALGFSNAYTRSIEAQIRAIDADTAARRGNIIALEQQRNDLAAQQLALKRQQDSIRAANAQLSEHQRRLEENSARYKALAQSAYAASFAITAVGAVGAVALKKAMNAAADYEQQVKLTFTQVDKGQASLKQLGALGIQVADTVGVKFSEVQNALYNIFSSTDANLAQSKILLAAFAKAAVAGQVSIDDASKGTMAILNAFQIPLEDVNSVLDVQFQLVRKGVGTYADFNSVMGRIVPSAVKAGANIKDVGAMLAFMTRNGLSAAMAATAGARAFDAISNPKSVANLEAYGIKIKDVKGNFLPLIDIVTQLSNKLSGLSETARAAKLNELFKGSGGNIQAFRFLNMVTAPGQLKQFQSFLTSMDTATGQFGDAYTTMADTTVTKTQLLKNRFQDLKITVGNAVVPYFLKLADVAVKATDWFSRLSPRVKDIVAKFAIFATTALLIVGPIVGILGIVGSLTSALAALGLGLSEVLLIIAGAVAIMVGLGVAFVKLYNNSQDFRDMLFTLGSRAKEVLKAFRDFGQGLLDSFEKRVGPALQHFWQVMELNVIPAIHHLVDVWSQNWVKNLEDALNKLKAVADFGFKYLGEAIEKDLIPAINDATTFYYAHQAAIDTVIKYLMLFGKWIAIIIGSAVIGALILAIIAVVNGIAGFIEGVKFSIDSIKAFIDYIKLWSSVVVVVFKAAKTYFVDLWKTWTGRISDLISALGRLPSQAKAVFNDAKNMLKQAGSDIIQGLIDGLESKVGNMVSKLNGIWNKVPDSIKGILKMGSPSKLFKKFGEYTVQGYINGVVGMADKVDNTIAQTFGKKKPDGGFVPSGWSDSSRVNGMAMASAGTNVTVNVKTNEIRPEYHSARLGQILAGRIA